MGRKFRIILAIFACKLTRSVLRVLRRGGTALPGEIAIRICPDILKYLAKDVKCAAITGTNGKTTSARMLEQFFIDSGASCLSNKSGSNLMRGIAAEFAFNATITGRPKHEFAVIECDEAASKSVFEYLDPKVVLVTNIFRDQLDRYGEISTTLENIKTGIKNSPNAVICLNADDSLTASIAGEIPNRAVYFGVDVEIYENHTAELSDAPHCIHCKASYEYDYVTYAHLGGFRCPSCGYARRIPDIAVTEIVARDADSQTIKLSIFGETIDITINQPGGYNIYNAAGAISAAMEMGFTPDAAKDAMQRFECGFGRMEKLELNGVPVRIILVKNPTGCDQALNYLSDISGDALFAVCLNDRLADGTDVSWIWDVHFEKLLDIGEKLRGILVSGVRANDMALRLKYAGVPEERMCIFGNQGEMLNAALAQDVPVYIMPTYTAMLGLRDRICREFGIKDFWK